MSFVPSLLQAIVRLDGEAVVLHVGEKPYVVTPTGQVDLATRGLTFDAVTGILNQLLPLESQTALDEFGAAKYELPASADLPGEHFTIVAARGGDDVWLEIRRRRVPDEDQVPVSLFGQPPAGAPRQAAPTAVFPPPARVTGASAPSAPPTPAMSMTPGSPADDALTLPAANQLFPGSAADTTTWDEVDLNPLGQAAAPAPAPPPAPPVQPAAPRLTQTPPPKPAAPAPPRPVAPTPPPPAPPVPKAAPPAPPRPPAPVVPIAPAPSVQPMPPPTYAPQPAPVLPLARSPIRTDLPPPVADQTISGLDRLLRQAAARGASVLYLASGSRPAMRVDGDVQTLAGGPALGPNDVESLLLTLMPERNAEALRTGVASEWICDLPDLGRIRCMSFRDNHGPGGVFRLMPTRIVSAAQLGLTREIMALAIEPEGLVLVAGPRSSGKRTLITALVDLINRGRRDYVITVESEINVTHEQIGSFVSQREVRGGVDEMLAVARGALREDPDVLVLEDIRTTGMINLALDAASSGQLVIGGFPAPSASGAIDRIIDLYPPEIRRHVQLSLAQNLRGVVSQVLLRKTGGGRVAAREVLLNTPAVRSVLAEGRTSQLPLAIEGGRVHGMTPLNDALIGYVQSGIVDVREAHRRAADRAGFLALLKRHGLDASAIERYA